jgi:hypothetical protein
MARPGPGTSPRKPAAWFGVKIIGGREDRCVHIQKAEHMPSIDPCSLELFGHDRADHRGVRIHVHEELFVAAHPHGGFLHAGVHPLYHTAAAFLLDHVVDALLEALIAGLIECFGSRHSAHFPRAEVPPLKSDGCYS